MRDPEARTVFAGVDGRTDTEPPEWYRQHHRGDNPVIFAEAVRDLPQAVETAVAYQNPYTDEWVETKLLNAPKGCGAVCSAAVAMNSIW